MRWRRLRTCEGDAEGRPAHLFSPGVFRFGVEEFVSSAPGLSQRPQHVAVGRRTEGTNTEDDKSPVNIVTHGGFYPRPQAKRRLCCTPSLSSCRVSSGFWM